MEDKREEWRNTDKLKKINSILLASTVKLVFIKEESEASTYFFFGFNQQKGAAGNFFNVSKAFVVL